MIENSNPILNQVHNGVGNNISGDQNQYITIYQEISPKSISKAIESILLDLKNRKNDSAKTKLDILKTVEALDDESKAIIDTLYIHFNLAENNELETAFFTINTFLTSHKNSQLHDLCLSAFIRLCCKKNNERDALDRYAYENHPSIYANEAYYELLADENTLIKAFENNKFTLKENELIGIIRGAFRVGNSQLSYEVSEWLNNSFHTHNSQVLLLFSQALKLNPIVANTHYWLCSPELRNELFDIANRTVTLCKEPNQLDSRLFNIAVPITDYLHGEHSELLSLCRGNINIVRRLNEKIAVRIDRSLLEDDINSPELLIEKAVQDEKYKDKLINNLLNEKSISYRSFYILSRIASSKQLREWIEKDGKILGENEYESDLYNLHLKLLSIHDNKEIHYIDKVKNDFINVMEKYKEKISHLNPEYAQELAQNLSSAGLPYEGYCLLGSLIDMDKYFWNSPFVNTYIHCLYESQQYLKLSTFLEHIQKESWDISIFIIKAALFELDGNFDKAQEMINEGIELDRLNLIAWEYKINLNRRLKNENIKDLLQEIPEELFDSPTKTGYRLLILMPHYNLFKKAEKFIISWFIQDPNKNAIYMSNFNFNLREIDIYNPDNENSLEEHKPLLSVSNEVGNCLGGVTYKSDNKIFTKLIVKDIKNPHPALLDYKSPIVKILSGLNVGEPQKNGIETIEVVERMTPYVAAFRISIELREALNDGRDVFHSFSVPEDPEGMIQVLKEKISFTNKIENSDIFSNPAIPIIFKSRHINSLDPIKAALEQFTHAKFVKHDLISLGYEYENEAILDIYTICYLSLTQLSKNLSQIGFNIKITNETKLCIQNWIKQLESGNYLLAGIDDYGNLIRNTAEDIKRNFGDTISEMEHIINTADVVYPRLFNTPKELLELQHFIDNVTYSTIVASISLDIPWLCIDQAFGTFFKALGFKLYNPYNLFLKLGRDLNFESKKLGLYLHTLNCIPYTTTLNDFYLLAKSEDNLSYIYLIKLINKYPQAIKDNIHEHIEFLSIILSIFIHNGYFNGKFLERAPEYDFKVNSPFTFGVEDVFYTCCNCILNYPGKMESDKRIAIFIRSLIRKNRYSHSIIAWLKIAASLYISGHFLSFEEINKYLSQNK
ncbi:GapS6b family protein [Leminorella grimontii]|uniref:GapS6b family protein n=1 Tax=Leminorella grimontii TaxID=82981 RepID=UPI00208D202A|nr:hypothetical protein [Leminorella grimontii]GKX60348.1 hypothetical protein SOASR031_26630 [Leminorella grimontii]